MEVGDVTTINSCVCGGVSILLNSVLIFVIHKRSLKVLGTYKYMMISATLCDISLSFIYLIGSPTFAAVEELSSLLIVKGGIQLPRVYSLPILIIFMWLLCVSIVTSPSLFVFRYFQICKANFLNQHYRSLRYLFVVPVFISSSCCLLICFAAWPTDTDIETFKMIAHGINVYGNYTFMVASLYKFHTMFDTMQSIAMWFAAVYLIIVMVCALLIMLYCSKCIVDATNSTCNGKTRQLQERLYRMLIVQFLVPFAFIHIPFYLSVLAPVFDINTGDISGYLPFLLAWSPAINPVVIFYFVHDYRKYLWSKLRRRRNEHSSSNSIFMTNRHK